MYLQALTLANFPGLTREQFEPCKPGAVVSRHAEAETDVVALLSKTELSTSDRDSSLTR